jgi:hypothetical protein
MSKIIYYFLFKKTKIIYSYFFSLFEGSSYRSKYSSKEDRDAASLQAAAELTAPLLGL